MEPLRPQVDRLVLDFVRSHTFTSSDFILNTRGICRLHPQLARQVTRLMVSDTPMQKTITGVLEGLDAQPYDDIQETADKYHSV